MFRPVSSPDSSVSAATLDGRHVGWQAAAMQKPRLSDLIAFALTDDIVSRRLAPGAALDEGTLGRRFGASRTPVREALRELAASGLVEIKPHRAPVVVAVDEARIAEMFEVMADLEALCARRASRAMTPEQRISLEAHHREMGEAVRRGDVAAYRAANVIFHVLIYEGAQNSYLREITQATRARIAPYRGAQLEAAQRLAQSYAEHDAIVDAILQGAGDQAAQLMRDHLAVTRDTLARIASVEMKI
jgi:DNA-binding GntR family transcriptional regulator